MAIAPQRAGIGIRRHFTTAGTHPYDEVVWERRDARITNYRDGSVAFEQLGVEVPGLVEPQRHEHPRPEVLPRDPRHPGARVVAAPGGRPGRRHRHRLGRQGRLLRRRRGGRGLLRRAQAPHRPPDGRLQLAGVVQHRRGRRAPAGLGLLHPVGRRHDGLDPQLVHRGGRDLQGRLRRRGQPVADPLVARVPEGRRHGLGPVSFMRGADASAGTIKSGGKTRRAAKMVILDADHPDIEDFIWCKATEERKARVLRDAGFDMDLDGKDSISLQYQNANNSVRVTDEFMQAVIDGGDWDLVTRDGATPCAPCRPATSSVSSPRRPGSAPTPACSSTPPSTSGTRPPTPGGSTAPTRARSTCTSTTRRATWPAST